MRYKKLNNFLNEKKKTDKRQMSEIKGLKLCQHLKVIFFFTCGVKKVELPPEGYSSEKKAD